MNGQSIVLYLSTQVSDKVEGGRWKVTVLEKKVQGSGVALANRFIGLSISNIVNPSSLRQLLHMSP